MKVYPAVIQGSEEWLRLRMGIPSASVFDQIVTPKKLELSKSSERLANRLIAEWILGYPLQEEQSQWMDRGQELEDQAVSSFENIWEVETDRIGFISNDAGTIGCSPDRLIGADELLEIKVPSPGVHVSYMRNKHVDFEYMVQLQGQLWISEREKVRIFSYHPTIPSVVITVPRDEEYIASLKTSVEQFSETLEAAKLEMERLYGPFVRMQRPAEEAPIDTGLNDELVDAVWARAQRQYGRGEQG